MLLHLSIRNIVLIEQCEIPFAAGLNVLTGETGAGKSILLDSLGLALGARAESGLIRAGETQASVTAEFDISENRTALDVLDELGIEPEETLIIRRQLQAGGKTRAWVNDQPISVTALRRIGDTLMEIHGQHDQRSLLDARHHIDLLDAFGRLTAQKETVREAYEEWRFAKHELETLLENIDQAERERDYLEHMRRELGTLDPQVGEEAELAELRATMMHSEKYSEVLSHAMQELTGNNVDGALHAAQRLLTRSTDAEQERFGSIIEALDRAQIELHEALNQLEEAQENAQYDPQKLEDIEERLFALKGAARKYRVDVDTLPELLEDVDAKLDAVSNQHFAKKQLQDKVNQTQSVYLDAAQALSQARGAAAQELQQRLMKELVPLKMGQTRFRIVQEELPQDRWSVRGTDHIEFEAATNAGQAYAPLARIASGGELSRFMLALKVVLAGIDDTPSYIFDEIDTGTGGAVADAIGARLALLADRAQVLVVTHLPQVAARGHNHLFIEKTEKKGLTHTHVRELEPEERKEELARMLAGETVTEEARGAAGKLMQAAG